MSDRTELSDKIKFLQNEVHRLEVKNQSLLNKFNESQKLSSIGSWSWDLKTNKVEWSDEVFSIFGISPNSVEPTYELALNHVHENDKVRYEAKIRQALDRKESYHHEIKIRKTDNSIRSVISRGSLMLNEKAEYVRMIGTIQDITYTKKLMQSNIQLEQFAHILSHDFKGPLRTIISFIGLLNKSIVSKIDLTEVKMFEFVATSARELSELVESLLENSNINSKNLNLNSIPVNPFMNSIIASLDVMIKERKVEITINKMPEFVIGDRIKLRQVIQNIISNSIKYSKPEIKPIIEINYIQDEIFHRFVFKDNGIGIDPSEQQNIFKSHYQVNNEKAKSGNGLGLFICKQILELHNGKIWVESNINEGSKFYFEFPKNLSETLLNDNSKNNAT